MEEEAMLLKRLETHRKEWVTAREEYEWTKRSERELKKRGNGNSRVSGKLQLKVAFQTGIVMAMLSESSETTKL